MKRNVWGHAPRLCGRAKLAKNENKLLGGAGRHVYVRLPQEGVMLRPFRAEASRVSHYGLVMSHQIPSPTCFQIANYKLPDYKLGRPVTSSATLRASLPADVVLKSSQLSRS